MISVIVNISVKEEAINDFISMTRNNVNKSRNEPGIHNFKLIQSINNICDFILIEVYENDECIAAHKKSPHYAIWKEKVESMMAKPRSSIRYLEIE